MGFILMFDITDEQSFINIRNWWIQIQTHSHFDKPDAILIGTKADLEGMRRVTERRAKNLAAEFE